MRDHKTSIDIGVLRRQLDVFLSELEDRVGSVEVADDYFWSIPLEDAFEVYVQPKELTIGQVSETWTNVDHDGEHVDYAAVWFGDLLRALGHELIGRRGNAGE